MALGVNTLAGASDYEGGGFINGISAFIKKAGKEASESSLPPFHYMRIHQESIGESEKQASPDFSHPELSEVSVHRTSHPDYSSLNPLTHCIMKIVLNWNIL